MERLPAIPCKVAPDLWPSSVCVRVEFPNGEVMSDWFDKSYVAFDGELSQEKEIDGRFRVTILEEDASSFLVRLGTSSCVRIPKDFLLPFEKDPQVAQ